MFYFPVDIDFALSEIKVDFVDLDEPEKMTSVVTVIEERKKAEQIYDDTVAEGKKLAIIAKTVNR